MAGRAAGTSCPSGAATARGFGDCERLATQTGAAGAPERDQTSLVHFNGST